MIDARTHAVAAICRPRAAKPTILIVRIVWNPIQPYTAGVIVARCLTRYKSHGSVRLTIILVGIRL